MRNLFLDKWPFFILSAFPLLGMRLTVWAIALFTLSALVKGKFSLKQDVPTGFLFACVGLFLIILIRSLIPEYNKESLSYIEVSISLLVLPLAFHLKKDLFDANDKAIATWIFVSSATAVFVFGMTKALFLVSSIDLSNHAELSFHIRTYFEETVNYHPTYASIIAGIAILKLLDLFIVDVKKRVLTGVLILIMLTILALLASRTPIASTLGCMILLTALRSKSIMNTLAMLVIIAGSIALFYTLVPSFSSRFKEVSIVNTQIPDKKSEDSFNLRVGIFKCGMDIIKENWLWGVGTGKMNSRMNECYDTVAAEVYKDRNYNTHNQLMDYWGRLGLMGPLGLVLIFLAAFFSLWMKKDWCGFCLALLLLGAIQTENLLTRQHGIVTFCYFLGLHIFAFRNPDNNTLDR
jgi:hypothetical protein